MKPMSSSADDLQNYSNTQFLRDIATYVRPYRGRFWLATFARVCGDVANLVPAYATAAMVTFLTTYERGQSVRMLWWYLSAILAAYIVRQVGLYIAKRIMYAVSEKVALDAYSTALEHIATLGPTWHEHEPAGSKIKRIDRGAYGLDRVLRMWITNVVEIVISCVGILIILSTIDIRIALLTGAFVFSFYFLARYFIIRAREAADVVNRTEEDVWGLMYETVHNVRTVQVLNMSNALMQLVRKSMSHMYEKILVRIFWFQTGSTTRTAWGYAFQVLVLGIIAWGVVTGRYEVGFLVLFNNYFMRIWSSVEELSEVVQDFIIAKQGVGRMAAILATPGFSDSATDLAPVPDNWQELALHEVTFAYEGERVLDGVSLRIRRGEKVGLVGLSGAGKSTLFKLLLREHEPQTGAVTLDGVPVSAYTRQSYFTHVAVVLQETEVFNLTLAENILLAGSTEAKDADALLRALTVAHVTDFLHKLPQGKDTLIGEKGVRLSGGERQRLGIARAVYKQPKLLLLDEATSHLDVESEEKIRASLHELFQGITALVIAHRLTTIQQMDRIVVLEKGRVIEEGTFAELQACGGRFHELWEKQRL